MDLKEITENQRKFDLEHGWIWDVDDEKQLLERLKYVAIAINGEAGEFANILKKSMREDFPEGKLPSAEKMKEMKRELVDIFIYTIIASTAMKMDLEKEYLEKMETLRERFKKFEGEKK